jgi:hypothetical protein
MIMPYAPAPHDTAVQPFGEDDLWLLSYYRSSEIDGAVFFGRVAEMVRSPELSADVAQHFADEASHAAIWTRCITDLGEQPLRIAGSYQSQYFDAIGVPANLMEVMAVTHVFEKRVIGQYHRQLRFPGTHPRVRQALDRIMPDERWHLRYVRRALAAMSDRYGADHVADTVARYTAADREVYAKTLAEYGGRVAFLADKLGTTSE